MSRDNDNDDTDIDDYDKYGVDLDVIEEEEEDKDGDDSDDDNEEEELNIKQTNTTTNETKNFGENRITNNIMTKFEYARLISGLSEMYAAGLPLHPILQKNKGDIYDPLDLAQLHVDKFLRIIPCPINIERPIPDGSFDVWSPRDMILPSELVTYKLIN